MILIFDYFETLLNNRSIDFNRGLRPLWERYYQDKCSFEEIKAYGEKLFEHLLKLHKEGREFAFVKEELPLYAEKYGGNVIPMTVEEEADFLMLCNDMEPVPGVTALLEKCKEKHIPMYVLSNSGFRGAALMEVLHRFGIGKYFEGLWSSADFGRIKPCKELFDMAIEEILRKHPVENRKSLLFVGDMYETDVKGAHRSGIKVAWNNRRNEIDTKQLATYSISGMKQLQEIVELQESGVDIQVMKYGHRYWNATADLAQNCSWRAGGHLAKLMSENLFEEEERVLVALVDGDIAGFCTYAKKDELPEEYDFTPFIGFMFVAEGYRGRRL
ncbi:MAG: GNAT family N-acetyltransferase [Acetatifactor sp.]